jgi:hypothetical protein
MVEDNGNVDYSTWGFVSVCFSQSKELVSWLRVYHDQFLLAGGELARGAGITA